MMYSTSMFLVFYKNTVFKSITIVVQGKQMFFIQKCIVLIFSLEMNFLSTAHIYLGFFKCTTRLGFVSVFLQLQKKTSNENSQII